MNVRVVGYAESSIPVVPTGFPYSLSPLRLSSGVNPEYRVNIKGFWAVT